MEQRVGQEVRELVERLAVWFQAVLKESESTLESDFRPSFVVALSGGVDSAVVAKSAMLQTARVIAATAVSPSVAAREVQDADSLCSALGVEHVKVLPGEIADPKYRLNDGLRCYHCKSHLYDVIRARFPKSILLSGTNADDLGDYRPGLQAAEEYGVRAPLAELGISKAQVRKLAGFWQLELADKPASPCLASRLAYGVEVTPERLRRVEQAEELLRKLGFWELRVRVHPDEIARIEVPETQFDLLMNVNTREELRSQMLALGFRYVTLDLEGFRSGNLNAAIESSLVQISRF